MNAGRMETVLMVLAALLYAGSFLWAGDQLAKATDAVHAVKMLGVMLIILHTWPSYRRKP